MVGVLVVVLVVVLIVVVVTGGKQSQLLVRLTWTGMDLDWSLTKKNVSKNIMLEKNFCAQI